MTDWHQLEKYLSERLSVLKSMATITGYLLICLAAFSPTLNADSKNAGTKGNTSISQNATEGPPAFCSPLEPASGNIIRIDPAQTQRIPSLLANAKQGDTILLEDGYYNLNGINLWIATPGISLRSASGNPESVTLDGAYRSTQIITVAASDVSIAEITLKRAYTHPIHIVSSDAGDTKNTLIYRVNIIDPREQAIKINPHAPGHYVDEGTVACSSIRLTNQGRKKVNSVSGGCYTGGIDAHQARDWVVRDNSISGFWCPSGLSQHAIHFWKGSRDTVVERNTLSDNARGIGFGLLNDGEARTYNDSDCDAGPETYIGHYGGIVRNNFIHASSAGLFSSSSGFDCGICLWSSCNSSVLHNTIVSTRKNFSSIEWRFKGSRGISIYNNLASHRIRQRGGASAKTENNIQRAGRYLFVDSNKGDLRLNSRSKGAINKGMQLEPGLVDYDIDGERRDSKPDIGADEL